MITPSEIDNRFTYHPPNNNQQARYTHIRNYARDFAHYLINNVPDSRELSTALTKLEECVMHANAGIARHE